MKHLCLAILLTMAALPLPALGQLVEPQGERWALGEASVPGGRTFLFPPQAVPVRSWLLLPQGTVLTEAQTVTTSGRWTAAFPTVRIPDLRYAVEVPAHLLALTLRGRIPTDAVLERTLAPPPLGAQPWVVRSHSELRVDLPPWKVAEGWTATLELSRPVDSPWQLTVVSDTRRQTFHFDPTVRRWNYAPQAWGLVPSTLLVRGPDPRLNEVSLRAVDALSPLPADPPTLLAWPVSQWRAAQREWFHWSGTTVLVLVTADYAVQDAYLKRLAFYVEKTGYRGRLVTDEEVANLHAWNAHDYAAPDLARFFTQAARQGFPLRAEELELRERLVSQGILFAEGPGVWRGGEGALVGISAQSPPALRSTLFVHEAFHGLYFTSPGFRSGVKAVWDGLSEPAREAFRTYLARSRYDPSDEGLMINEFQAYVLQRPAAEWEGFFRNRVLSSGVPPRATLVEDFLAACGQLDSLTKALFGFSSGNVSGVSSSSGT